MAPTRADVCVVGGGPAGLLLGLLLAKRGAEVLVLEGHETFDREFRGEVLQPSTAHLLDELGLLEYVLAQPHSDPDRRQGAVRRRSRRASSLPAHLARVSLRHLDATAGLSPGARRKAAPFPSFQCWMGAKVTELVEEDGAVVACGAAATARSRSRSGPTSSWARTAATPRYDGGRFRPSTSTMTST